MRDTPGIKRRKVPSTAAVTITAPDGSYAEVIGKAKREVMAVKLRALGVEDMRIRRGKTGAYVLGIPGPEKKDREAKAEALAAKMRRGFAEDSRVKISRPAATVRIRDLDKAATTEDVVETVVGSGVAQREDLKATISSPVNGMGVAWMRCPITAADELHKAAESGDGRPQGWKQRRRDPSTVSGAGGRGTWPRSVAERTGRGHATGVGWPVTLHLHAPRPLDA